MQPSSRRALVAFRSLVFRDGARVGVAMTGPRSIAGVCALGLALLAWASPVGAAWGGAIRVSTAPGGEQLDVDSFATAVSPGGRLVVFWSASFPPQGPFLRDRVTGATVQIPGVEAFLPCGTFSANGRFLAIGGPPTAADSPEVVVYDVLRGTSQVIVGSRGCPAITGQGRFVAFESGSGLSVLDRRTGVEVGLDLPSDASEPALSPSGRFLAFVAGGQVHVHDFWTGVTTLESVAVAGGDGDGRSFGPSISSNGRVVSFTSEAENLVDDDGNAASDVFARDRMSGVTWRVSSSPLGEGGAGESLGSSLSANGRYVAFMSQAGDLVAGDTVPGTWDAFVRDLATGTTTMVSNGADGFSGEGGLPPKISADGWTVVFDSEAPDLVPGDSNELRDVFVSDR